MFIYQAKVYNFSEPVHKTKLNYFLGNKETKKIVLFVHF